MQILSNATLVDLGAGLMAPHENTQKSRNALAGGSNRDTGNVTLKWLCDTSQPPTDTPSRLRGSATAIFSEAQARGWQMA